MSDKCKVRVTNAWTTPKTRNVTVFLFDWICSLLGVIVVETAFIAIRLATSVVDAIEGFRAAKGSQFAPNVEFVHGNNCARLMCTGWPQLGECSKTSRCVVCLVFFRFWKSSFFLFCISCRYFKYMLYTLYY